MSITLRPLDLTTDLPALARLISLTRVEPVSPQQVAEWWRPTAGGVRRTLVAVDAGGAVVAMGDTWRDTWLPAGLFSVGVIVEPAWRNQGLGSRLLADVTAFAQARGATQLEAEVRDADPAALRFAEGRGFHMERHTFESVLDLTTFDERPFLPALERAVAAGLRFLSLANLAPVTETLQRRLYDLNRSTALDNPGNRGVFAPFDEFRQFVFEASWFRADGQIVAADGDRWVGLAAVAFYPETASAFNAFTGVDRGYRGQGLATALKVLAIRRAREYGACSIRTNNDSQNAPMLAINRKLGYLPEPGLYRVQASL